MELTKRDLRVLKDEGFIYFNLRIPTAEFLAKEVILQSQPKALKHEPCRLLSDAESAMDFHAADAILAVAQHPISHHPFIESERGILKDRADLDSELLFASTAEPDTPRLDEIVPVGVATRTGDLAIRPAEFRSVVEGALRIGEVNDGLL